MGLFDELLWSAAKAAFRSAARSGLFDDEGNPQPAELAPFHRVVVKPSANEDTVIAWRPQRRMRAVELVLSVIGDTSKLSVTALDIGNEPQFLSGGDLPASMFLANVPHPVPLLGSIVGPDGAGIELRVRNLGTDPLTLTGCIRGPRTP